MSSLMISSSGIRGIIGESMTPALAVEVASSFGTLIGKGPVVLGGDTRVSHDCIMSAFISGLLSVGTDIIHIGKVTTLSNKGKVGADINTDGKVNIDDIMSILKIIGGVIKHSDLSNQFVLRNNSETDPFTNNTFKIESPSSLTLDSYLLGDADGNRIQSTFIK